MKKDLNKVDTEENITHQEINNEFIVTECKSKTIEKDRIKNNNSNTKLTLIIPIIPICIGIALILYGTSKDTGTLFIFTLVAILFFGSAVMIILGIFAFKLIKIFVNKKN